MSANNSKHAKLQSYILQNQIIKAIKDLEEIAENIKNSNIANELRTQLAIYNQMLLFTFKDVNDPQRATIFIQLKQKLLTINDHLLEILNDNDKTSTITVEKQMVIRKALQEQISIENISAKINDADKSLRPKLFEMLFAIIWFTQELNEAQEDAITKLLFSGNTKYYEKSLIVSAITISLLHCFDTKKFNLLFKAYDTNGKHIWQRALIGLVLAYTIHDERINAYDELKTKIKLAVEDKGFERHIQMIIFQLIRTRETEQILEKLQKEIIPEMSKIMPDIEEKLDLDKILSDNLLEDENPDWEKLFENSSDILDKVEEISKLQIEGSDVFMSAFSNLKHFDFFKQTANWFLPFYKENQEINKILNQYEELDAETFAQGIERASYICNSDKYSLCLNLSMIPEAQQKMMLNLLKLEMKTMSEIDDEDQILDPEMQNKIIFTQYLQDIYRFYMLSKFKHDLKNIFKINLTVENTNFFKILKNKDRLIIQIGEFYMKKGYYNEAIDNFLKLDDQTKGEKGIYEKIAFAFQKTKNYEQALKYYKLAELFNSDSLWITKKLAFCSLKTGDHENALQYYTKAEAQQPENLHIIANKARCYLTAEKYEEALKAYFQIEYFEPDNIRVKRPLAWCSFVLGKFDSVEKYLNILIESGNAKYHDYINLGHVYFCKQQKALAVETYKKALQDISINKFEEVMLKDKKHLINNKVQETDIYLLLDFLRDNA